MGARTGSVTRQYIEAAPLPTHGGAYTIISHKFVIDETLAALAAQGLQIEEELYRCNMNAEVAQGVYHIKHGDDPEMKMMFTWANSYDKTMRFKCAVGAHVINSGNRIIAGSSASWGRKHTGTADQQTKEVIAEHIKGAAVHYKELVATKLLMKGISVPLQTRAEILGRLFFEKNALSTEQAQIIKNQFKAPEFDYASDPDSLWAMYNHISYALQKSHPRKWMEQQTLIHWFLCDHFGITANEIKAGAEQASPEPEVVVEITPQMEQEMQAEAEEILEKTDEEFEAGLSISEANAINEISQSMPSAEEIISQAEERFASENQIAEAITEKHGLDGQVEVEQVKQEGKSQLLEEWFLGECFVQQLKTDKVNKIVYLREGQEISEEFFKVSVELGWMVQPSLFAEEQT